MTNVNESVEQRLTRLTEQTAGLVARSDFADRVMVSIAERRVAPLTVDWAAQVMALARVGVVVATVAAAAVLSVAVNRSSSADQEEALAYGVVEAFE